MVWGTYLEENCPSSNGHLLDFGGSKSLPGWFGALFPEDFYRGASLKHTFILQFQEDTTLQNLKIGPENRCPRVPV